MKIIYCFLIYDGPGRWSYWSKCFTGFGEDS
jgi:hypothetical protein